MSSTQTATDHLTDLITEAVVRSGLHKYGGTVTPGGRAYFVDTASGDTRAIRIGVNDNDVVVYLLTATGGLLASIRFGNVSAFVVAAAVRAMIDEEN